MSDKVKSIERAKVALSGGVEKTKASVETAKEKIQEVSETVRKEAGRAGGFAKACCASSGTAQQSRSFLTARGGCLFLSTGKQE